uniref:Uncharacterized protein n=1 Tax=Anguilla anguilla TaxID=7936 RepID=A0A0E9QHG7_ANGAN
MHLCSRLFLHFLLLFLLVKPQFESQ